MNSRYYSNGKLMISGEYLVNRGSKALAVPLKLGQWFEVKEYAAKDPCIYWNAKLMDKEWFSAVISLPELEVVSSTDKSVSDRLVVLLRTVTKLNEALLVPGYGYEISTRMMFEHSWGLGSSSSLIANLSQWARINPFDLFFSVSDGSGYDVAAALAKGPILYSMSERRPLISPVTFMPAFHTQIWFAYLGHKQDTSESLNYFNKHIKTTYADIEYGNSLTFRLWDARTLEDFMKAMQEHEAFLANILQKEPVKDGNFRDFAGEIKSLGAWGGDFIMIASDQPSGYVKSYFEGKGINIMFGFEDLILS